MTGISNLRCLLELAVAAAFLLGAIFGGGPDIRDAGWHNGNMYCEEGTDADYVGHTVLSVAQYVYVCGGVTGDTACLKAALLWKNGTSRW